MHLGKVSQRSQATATPALRRAGSGHSHPLPFLRREAAAQESKPSRPGRTASAATGSGRAAVVAGSVHTHDHKAGVTVTAPGPTAGTTQRVSPVPAAVLVCTCPARAASPGHEAVVRGGAGARGPSPREPCTTATFHTTHPRKAVFTATGGYLFRAAPARVPSAPKSLGRRFHGSINLALLWRCNGVRLKIFNSIKPLRRDVDPSATVKYGTGASPSHPARAASRRRWARGRTWPCGRRGAVSVAAPAGSGLSAPDRPGHRPSCAPALEGHTGSAQGPRVSSRHGLHTERAPAESWSKRHPAGASAHVGAGPTPRG